MEAFKASVFNLVLQLAARLCYFPVTSGFCVLLNQSINQSTSESINQSMDPSINPSINRPINQSINQWTHQSIHQSIDPSINQYWDENFSEIKPTCVSSFTLGSSFEAWSIKKRSSPSSAEKKKNFLVLQQFFCGLQSKKARKIRDFFYPIVLPKLAGLPADSADFRGNRWHIGLPVPDRSLQTEKKDNPVWKWQKAQPKIQNKLQSKSKDAKMMPKLPG